MSAMRLFIEYDEDPGFQLHQHILWNDRSWTIIGIRDNGYGLWLSLK